MLDFHCLTYCVVSISWLDPGRYTGISCKHYLGWDFLWSVDFVLISRRVGDIAMYSTGIFLPPLTNLTRHVLLSEI